MAPLEPQEGRSFWRYLAEAGVIMAGMFSVYMVTYWLLSLLVAWGWHA